MKDYKKTTVLIVLHELFQRSRAQSPAPQIFLHREIVQHDELPPIDRGGKAREASAPAEGPQIHPACTGHLHDDGKGLPLRRWKGPAIECKNRRKLPGFRFCDLDHSGLLAVKVTTSAQIIAIRLPRGTSYS